MKSADPPSKCCFPGSTRVPTSVTVTDDGEAVRRVPLNLTGDLSLMENNKPSAFIWYLRPEDMCRTAGSKSVWHLYLFVFTQTSCVLSRSLHIRKCWFPSNQQAMLDSVWSLFISTGCSHILSTMHMPHFTFSGILLINRDVPLYFVWQWTRCWFYRAGALSSPTTVCWHLLITTLGKTGSVVHSRTFFWVLYNEECVLYDEVIGLFPWRKETSMSRAADVTVVWFWCHFIVSFVVDFGSFSHCFLHFFSLLLSMEHKLNRCTFSKINHWHKTNPDYLSVWIFFCVCDLN